MGMRSWSSMMMTMRLPKSRMNRTLLYWVWKYLTSNGLASLVGMIIRGQRICKWATTRTKRLNLIQKHHQQIKKNNIPNKKINLNILSCCNKNSLLWIYWLKNKGWNYKSINYNNLIRLLWKKHNNWDFKNCLNKKKLLNPYKVKGKHKLNQSHLLSHLKRINCYLHWPVLKLHNKLTSFRLILKFLKLKNKSNPNRKWSKKRRLKKSRSKKSKRNSNFKNPKRKKFH